MSEQPHQPYIQPKIELRPLPAPEDSGHHEHAEKQAFLRGVASGIRGTHQLVHEYAQDDSLAHTKLAYEANRADMALASAVKEEKDSRDQLTGLYNRKELDRVFVGLQNQNGQHRRGTSDAGPAEHSVLLIDVDHFKQFNDNHGHVIGDKVLKSVANATAGSVRERDVVVRYGGEEIAVILPRAELRNAVTVAEVIRETIKNSPVTVKGESLRVTASIGVAALDLNGTLEDNISAADRALYWAKEHGRDQTVSIKDVPADYTPAQKA